MLAIGLIITGILLELQSGSFGISSIICLSVLGYALVLYVGIYFVGLRRAMAKLAAIPDGRCVYTLTEDTIEASSSMGSMALAWRSLSEVRRKGDIVLLGFHGAGYSTIPAAQVPGETLAYLVSHARKHGAKISGL